MPRKSPEPDLDFNIFVDPSCLSAPMDEETPLTQKIQDIPVVAEPTEKKDLDVDEAQECNKIRWKDIHLGPSRGSSRPQSAMEASTVEETIDDLLEEIQDADHDGHDDDEASVHDEDGHDDVNTFTSDEATGAAYTSGDDVREPDRSDSDDDVSLDGNDDGLNVDATDKDSPHEEANHDPREEGLHEDEVHGDEDHREEDHGHEEQEEVSVHTEDSYTEDATQPALLEEDGAQHSEIEGDNDHHNSASVHEAGWEDEESFLHDRTSPYGDEPSLMNEPGKDDEPAHEETSGHQEDDSTLEEADQHASSRRTSTLSDRRASLRTEALIQAAARAVVAKIEERAIAAVHSHRNSLALAEDDGDISILSAASRSEDYHAHNHVETTTTDSPTSRRHSSDSSGSQVRHQPAASTSGDDEAGDSSSHHEAEDDVFSDRSARSSLGSFDGALPAEEDSEDIVKTPVRRSEQQHSHSHSRTNSPRLSGVSSLSQYEKDAEEFVIPATMSRSSRDTPRMPFRTPSDVRAIQMSSPTPSVFNGASPRSGKRNGGLSSGSGSGLPTVSRLGSPTVSAQYSPKGRSTPPRFKMRKEAPPLVLLHVTLLPLRWVWGDVLDGLDASTASKGGPGTGKDVFEPSDELKALRDAWRQLQDRVGDTVLERGILLPHPQNDYEVLEERLLEALELPLRRRARILECGHYLGPTNEMADDEESETDDEYDPRPGRRYQRGDRRHWCATCKGEIKFEDLGPGRVFRVKVYASNGLMKAGAWAACWKEMERVDVEIEPIVETALHRELERLSAFQAEQEEHRQRQVEDEERARHEEEMRAEEEVHLPAVPQPALYDDHHGHPDIILSSPPPPAIHASPPSPPQISSPVLRAHSPSPLLQAPIDTSEARRRRDEARLREIYGTSPPPPPEFDHLTEPVPSSTHAERPPSSIPPATAQDPDTARTTASSYMPPPSPHSPSEEAHARRTQRRTTGGAYQGASLPELVLEAAKVLMRDRKNVAIAVLAFFVLLLALRPGTEADVVGVYRVGVPVAPVLGGEGVVEMETGVRADEEFYRPATTIAETVDTVVPVVTVSSSLEGVAEDRSSMEHTAVSISPEPEATSVGDKQPKVEAAPASDASFINSAPSVVAPPEETVTEKKVVRIIETVTETVKVSITATESVVAPQQTKTVVVAEMPPQASAETEVVTKADHVASPAGFILAVCPVERTDVCAAY